MISASLLALFASTAPVEAPPLPLQEEESKWTGSFRLNFTRTSGNSITSELGMTFDAERRGLDDRWTLHAYRNAASQSGVAQNTKQDYGLSAKYDYFWSERSFVYGTGAYSHDRVANLDSRLSFGAGVGHQFREDDDIKFSAEAGLSHVSDEFYVNPVPPPVIEDSYVAVRLAYDYWHQLTDELLFEQNAEALPSIDDTSDVTAKATSRLSHDLSASLDAYIEHVWDWDNTPSGPTVDSSDHQIKIGVGWTF